MPGDLDTIPPSILSSPSIFWQISLYALIPSRTIAWANAPHTFTLKLDERYSRYLQLLRDPHIAPPPHSVTVLPEPEGLPPGIDSQDEDYKFHIPRNEFQFLMQPLNDGPTDWHTHLLVDMSQCPLLIRPRPLAPAALVRLGRLTADPDDPMA